MNLYSQAIGCLSVCLVWPHNGMVLENTQFEFSGFSINVPRIFLGLLSVRHANQPTYPTMPPMFKGQKYIYIHTSMYVFRYKFIQAVFNFK